MEYFLSVMEGGYWRRIPRAWDRAAGLEMAERMVFAGQADVVRMTTHLGPTVAVVYERYGTAYTVEWPADRRPPVKAPDLEVPPEGVPADPDRTDPPPPVDHPAPEPEPELEDLGPIEAPRAPALEPALLDAVRSGLMALGVRAGAAKRRAWNVLAAHPYEQDAAVLLKRAFQLSGEIFQ